MTRLTWRFARLLVLAVLLVTGGATAFQVTTVLQQRADSMTRYVRVDVWAVQQTEFALQRFRNVFTRHVAGDIHATNKAVRDQLGQARSTMTLLRGSNDYSELRMLVNIDGATNLTANALNEVEQALGERTDFRNDLPLLGRIENVLAEPTHAMRQLAVDMAHMHAALQDGDLKNVRWLTGINRWMLLAFFGVTAVFIAILFGEIRAAKKAERSATNSERQTRYIAQHDKLTGLPNRMSFREQLHDQIASTPPDEEIAVYLLDLDDFKIVNDTFGHEFGDDLLIAVAERLREVVGESDTLVRLGGDEFAIVQTGKSGEFCWEPLADQIRDLFILPFELKERKVHIGTSIGIARFPSDGHDVDSLLQAADVALYAAKEGGSRYQAYDAGMTAKLERRKELQDGLRQALNDGQLEVFFQPQVNLSNQGFIGAEALVRWNHPEDGFVSPGEFIPVAEETGLILPLGRWVLETACREALEWSGEATNGTVAVNLSPSQFLYEDIVELTHGVLQRTGLPAHRLELEITEGMLMRDEQAAIETLERLHGLGVQLAIDDFGTGYSSLAYLKSFRVDKLKVDQSFVRDMEEDPDDQKIVRAVIELAASLGLKTIAEGIETPGQMQLLIELGCQEGQGYFFGKPMSAADFRDWVVESQNTDRHAQALDQVASF